jgi:hypothetical protein
MQLPRSTASFQLSVTVAAVLAIGCCLISTANVGRDEAAQAAVFQEETPPTPRSARMPILVEFFPSKECSECSTFDAVLARLDRSQPISEAHIIVLTEHADSMDDADPNFQYSFELFSRRQRGYQELFQLDSIGAPQIVVNGTVLSKGISNRQVEDAITEAVKKIHVVPLQFASVQAKAGTLRFILRDCPAAPGYVNVIASLVDPKDMTGVRSADSGGRGLAKAGVVRSFGIVGSSFRTRAVAGRPFVVPFYLPGVDSHLTGARAALEGKRLVVFVQVKHVGPVIGVASCTLHVTMRQPARNKQSFAVDPCPISD